MASVKSITDQPWNSQVCLLLMVYELLLKINFAMEKITSNPTATLYKINKVKILFALDIHQIVVSV